MITIICEKCGHTWIPRKEPELIMACPNCKNRKWRKNESEKNKGNNKSAKGKRKNPSSIKRKRGLELSDVTYEDLVGQEKRK
jgi:predicted  nucleic acid-binding Zn-ribbon protein